MKKSVLLISPNLYSHYTSKVKVAINPLPPLTLAVLAGPLLGHDVKIIDLALDPDYSSLIKSLKQSNPDYICITSLTPSFNEAKKIIDISKRYTNSKIILGGPHVSSFPKESLEESKADIAVKGEGDFILRDIIEKENLKDITGICYKKEGRIIKNPESPYIQNLDVLPYPAWQLVNIEKYSASKLVSKRNPVGTIETSRGCVYSCTYCNKNIFGKTFRIKSPKRVVSELKFMLNRGFKEIHILDDGFSTDMVRGKRICRMIIKEGLDFPWALTNGIRVDRVDEELMRLLRRAGCYKIVYGIESGNQEVLNRIKKGVKLEQVRKAVALANKYHLEVQGFFMFGLPGETEETMQQTIDFAKSLDLDVYKAAITMPLPGTFLYDELNRTGAMKVDWSLVSQQSKIKVYEHQNLKWETIYEYYEKFYKETMYRPEYIFKRIKSGLLNGRLFWDTYYFIRALGSDF